MNPKLYFCSCGPTNRWRLSRCRGCNGAPWQQLFPEAAAAPQCKFPRTLRWAGAFLLMGAGFWLALLLCSVVYNRIYVVGAQACEAWYEGEYEWDKIPEETM